MVRLNSMIDPSSGGREHTPLSIGSEDWPATAADKIISVVGAVRSHTVDNLSLVVRAAVYGLVAVIVGVALAVLIIALAVRMTDAYLPIGNGVGSATWAAYAFTGVLISVLGLGTWRARSSTSTPIRIAVAIDFALVLAVIVYGVIQAFV